MVSELEEFLMPILEEKGPNYMLFQQGRAFPQGNALAGVWIEIEYQATHNTLIEHL
jgi:hypothetical protein